MNIAKFFSEERVEQKISQAEFAFILRKTKGHLSNIERKEVLPSIQLLEESLHWLGFELTTKKLPPKEDAERKKELQKKLLEFKLRKTSRVRSPRKLKRGGSVMKVREEKVSLTNSKTGKKINLNVYKEYEEIPDTPVELVTQKRSKGKQEKK